MVTYDIGQGRKRVVENSQTFHDGGYHYVTFVRNGRDAILRVDNYEPRKITSSKLQIDVM